MEKGPSEYAENWTSPYQEVNHFYFHGYDMGFVLISDYSKAAKEFAERNDDEILIFIAKNGSIYKYDPDTNEFLILSHTGKIVTYFSPERGINYFYDQFEKYGSEWIQGGNYEYIQYR